MNPTLGSKSSYHAAQLSVPSQSLCPGVSEGTMLSSTWTDSSRLLFCVGMNAAAAYWLHCVCVFVCVSECVCVSSGCTSVEVAGSFGLVGSAFFCPPASLALLFLTRTNKRGTVPPSQSQQIGSSCEESAGSTFPPDELFSHNPVQQ